MPVAEPTPAAPPPPPPPAAKAGKVLTAPEDPNAPLDMTGDGFVTGDGDAYVGGVTAAAAATASPRGCRSRTCAPASVRASEAGKSRRYLEN